jgi:hypothetical protein
MRKVKYGLAILALQIGLTGCQPATYTMTVSGTPSGALIVTARGDAMGFGDDMGSIYAESVTIRSNGQDVWQMRRTPGPTPPCISTQDHDPFPFVIDRARNCWVLPEEPFRPQPGVTYSITASGLRDGYGTFRVTSSGAIENLSQR